MHLTTFSDNALRCLILLATTHGERRTAHEIAQQMGMSTDHLVKVLRRLNDLGYVDTSRGAGGGSRLATDAADIRLGALVRQTEQSLEMVECFREQGVRCPIAPVCKLPPVIDEALDAFFAVLDRYTLADMVRQPAQLRQAFHRVQPGA